LFVIGVMWQDVCRNVTTVDFESFSLKLNYIDKEQK